MNEAPRLELAASLFTLTLKDISSQIVAKSWETSDGIVRAHKSNAVVSVAIQIAAFLLHALSRSLPPTDQDYLNDFVYSPVVRLCCAELGNFVEMLQDAGAFSITVSCEDDGKTETLTSVFCGDDIESETLSAVDSQEGAYSAFSKLVANQTQLQEDAISYAAMVIAEVVTEENPAPVRATARLLLLHTLQSLDFGKISAHVQAELTLELLTYLRSREE